MKLFIFASFGILFIPLLEQAMNDHRWVQAAMFLSVSLYCINRMVSITGIFRYRVEIKQTSSTVWTDHKE